MRMRKWGLGFLRAGLTVVLLALLANLWVLVWGAAGICQADAIDAQADAVLVLGAGIRGSRPSSMLRDRLDQAVALYRAGKAAKILVSGAHSGAYYDEAAVMGSYLREQGVPAEAVVEDRWGLDTYSSLYRARHTYGLQSCIVVTQRYHLYRGVYYARCMGMRAWGVSCDRYLPVSRMPWYHAREFLSRVKAVWDVMYGRTPVEGEDAALKEDHDGLSAEIPGLA